LSTYAFYNVAVCSAHYKMSNGRTVSEQWTAEAIIAQSEVIEWPLAGRAVENYELRTLACGTLRNTITSLRYTTNYDA